MLHSEYTTSCFMAKSVVWHNFQSPRIRQTFHCFALNSYFIQPSVCYYVPFFFYVRLQVSFIPLRFRYFGRRFSFAQSNYQGKVKLCHSSTIFAKRIEIIFCERCWPWKLKSAKNNPYVFETKPRKFGDTKIFHYAVSFWMSYWHSEPWTCLLNGEYEEHIKM